MAAPRVVVAVLWALALLGGCYRVHGGEHLDAVDADRDAALDPPRDAGPDARPIDAAPDAPPEVPRDAGTDAPRCEGVSEEPLLHLCSFESGGGLPAHTPATLALFYSACVCDARRCTTTIDGDTIALDTWLCPEVLDCDDCATDLRCDIPPLDPGAYRVVVDGVALGTVVASDGPRTTRPTCWDVQDETGLECGGAATTLPPRDVCYREVDDVGTHVEISLLQALPACFVPGECSARLEGRRIVLAASAIACGSDPSCAGATVERVARCITPPLRDGDYVVEVEGTSFSGTLRIRDITRRGDVVCFPAE